MANIRFFLVTLLSLTTMLPLKTQPLSIYVSDAGNYANPPWQILKFDLNGQNGEVFINDHLDWPQDILFLEDDTVVLISNLNTGAIARFHANTGEFINIFASAIGGPTRMKIGSDGLLYVLQWTGNGKVKRYELNGTFVDDFTDTGVPSAIGLDWDISGNLYVSSYNGFVQKYDAEGKDQGVFINSNLAGPTNIWFDASGDLLVCDYNAGAVKRFSNHGEFKSIFIPNVPLVEGVAFHPNGNILLGVGGTSSVRMYSPDGDFQSTVVQPGALNLLTPNAVTIRGQRGPTAILSPSPFRDLTIVTPSVGNVFYFTSSELIGPDAIAEVMNTAGMMVQKISLADSTTWDASDLPKGMYIMTLRLTDQTQARQKIMVQH